MIETIKTNIKEYIYIVQSSITSKCKIGKTNDLEKHLKEYNNITDKSKANNYQYLFTCQVLNMTIVKYDFEEKFSIMQEETYREIYFYNSGLFKEYVNFIKFHKMFIKEIFIKTDKPKQTTKIIKKTIPSLEERGLTYREVMQQAQNIDNDEFYTRYEDIEKELKMYDKKIWKDKCVFCNCDDVVDNDDRNTSAFPLYFLLNFKELGLKKLICTHYSDKVDLFEQWTERGEKYVYMREFTLNGYKEFKDYPEGYTGSFEAPLSLKILNDKADIVCTNPPFSKAIGYWKLVIESGKNFIIISNITNAINSAFIPYFKNNQVWAGYNEVDWFLSPKKELIRAAGFWYTNIPINDRPKYKQLKIIPLKEIPEKHKKYDDSNTLLVDNCYIPSDYKKPFAVSTRPILNGLLEKGYKIVQEKTYAPYINGKCKFARVLVQKGKTL